MRAYFGMLSMKNPIATPLRGDIPSFVAKNATQSGLNLNFLTIDFSINSAHLRSIGLS